MRLDNLTRRRGQEQNDGRYDNPERDLHPVRDQDNLMRSPAMPCIWRKLLRFIALFALQLGGHSWRHYSCSPESGSVTIYENNQIFVLVEPSLGPPYGQHTFVHIHYPTNKFIHQSSGSEQRHSRLYSGSLSTHIQTGRVYPETYHRRESSP